MIYSLGAIIIKINIRLKDFFVTHCTDYYKKYKKIQEKHILRNNKCESTPIYWLYIYIYADVWFQLRES